MKSRFLGFVPSYLPLGTERSNCVKVEDKFLTHNFMATQSFYYLHILLFLKIFDIFYLKKQRHHYTYNPS